MNIAIVGAGTVGTAVAVRWARAGHAIVGATGRAATPARIAPWLPGVSVSGIAEAVAAADVVAIAVPDGSIASVAAEAAPALRPGAAALHFSGALGLDVLETIADVAGVTLALHPLQTFADVAGAIERLEGSAVAVTARGGEGWRLGDALAVDLGGAPFHLEEDARPAYHAAAVFASNYLVVIAGAAEELLGAAGVPNPRDVMAPLQEGTLDNVRRLGPRDALTGPAVRGDAGTIERNLDAVAAAAPHLVASYVVLCRAALDLAGARLASTDRAAVEKVLARWS
jgi:predicted short-subunit dehydrogenase-like oxidoreductase (DUF2520 family)